MKLARILTLAVASAALAGFTPGSALAGVGQLDPSFGTAGTEASEFSQDAASPAAAGGAAVIAPNGDIYQAGSAPDSAGKPALFLARFLPTGALDTSFGTGGVSMQQVGQGTTKSSGETTGPLKFLNLAVTPSGEVLVPADASDPSGGTQLAIAEFTPSGGLDSGFGTGGVYYDDALSTASPKSATANGVAVQSDGKIVITGNAALSSGHAAVLQRLNRDGTLDSGFATGGTYTVSSASASPTIGQVIIDSSGNIVFAGQGAASAGNLAIMLGRLTGAGADSPGFPKYVQASKAGPLPQSGATSIIQAADGDYVLGGQSYVDSPGTSGGVPEAVAVAFTSSGLVDSAFGPDGTGITTLLNPGQPPVAIAQQKNGRLVFIGVSDLAAGSLWSTDVRTLANGTLDTAFATPTQLLGIGFFVTWGAIEPDGQLLLSGSTVFTATVGDAVLAKVTLDTPPAILVGPVLGIAGQPVALTATVLGASSAPTISWDLGSGSFSDASGPTATKTFVAPGTYTVHARVTDDDGLSTTASATVTIVAPQPAPTPKTIVTTVIAPTPLPASECTHGSLPTASVAAEQIEADGLLLAGSAAAHCPSRISSVTVAIARFARSKCSFLSARHHWGKYGGCTPTTFLTASGAYSWAFGLRLNLAKGTYWVWPRARDDHNLNSSTSRHLALIRR